MTVNDYLQLAYGWLNYGWLKLSCPRQIKNNRPQMHAPGVAEMSDWAFIDEGLPWGGGIVELYVGYKNHRTITRKAKLSEDMKRWILLDDHLKHESESPLSEAKYVKWRFVTI